MRRLLLVGLLLLVLPQPAHAFLPAAIERTIRTWFNATGQLSTVDVAERAAPSVSVTGKCRLYVDSTAHNLKVSCNGGAYSSVVGSGTATSGCTESAGTLTCAAFDVPAAAASGGCVTLKEGSNNGTSTAKVCAPANLTSSRTNTLNADGTIKGADVEMATTYDFLPGPAAVPAGVKTATLTANLMRCVTFVKHGTLANATKYAIDVIDAGGTASVCLYADADAGALIFPLVSAAPATAIDTSGTGSKTQTGLDPFTLSDGTAYRLCWTSANTAVTLAAAGTVDANIVNAFATRAGNATNGGTTGVCPTTTGALGTGASLAVPNVQISQ